MPAHARPARPAPPYSAQLRVYEPLAAFPDGERELWQAYVAGGRAPSTELGPALERDAGVAALLGLPPACVPDLEEHAFVTQVDGVTLVCPWRTRLRSWEALADAREELPDVLVDAFVPRAVADAAEQDLLAWRAEHPDLRVHVLSSTWQVPVRWFVLVEAQERLVYLGAPLDLAPGAEGPDGPSGAGLSAGLPAAGLPAAGQRSMSGSGRVSGGGFRAGRALAYRTPMSRARRRTARALAVLRRSMDDATATTGVEQLARWLEEFHPRSLVELDYGGLVHLLDDEALTGDVSAGDVAEALVALGAGEGERATAAYARVTRRMKALQAVERAG